MPEATVLIPTYNRQEHLDGVLSALADQAEPDVPFAVVLVDDGSDPPVSLEGRAWPFEVELVRLEANVGRAAARNAGLAAVRTRLTIFLDDDMRPLKGFIRAHVEGHGPGSRSVLLGTVVFAPEVPRDRLSRYLETRGIAKLRDDEPIPFKYFLTYNSSASTELLRHVGGFDDRLRVWGGEDMELGWRLEKAGATFVRAPEASALHAHRRSVGEVSGLAEAFAARSLPLILETHPELVVPLRADLFGPRRYRQRRPVRRGLVRLATHPPLPALVRAALSRWPRLPWPDRLFDYLIASAWRRGLDRDASGRRQ